MVKNDFNSSFYQPMRKETKKKLNQTISLVSGVEGIDSTPAAFDRFAEIASSLVREYYLKQPA